MKAARKKIEVLAGFCMKKSAVFVYISLIGIFVIVSVGCALRTERVNQGISVKDLVLLEGLIAGVDEENFTIKMGFDKSDDQYYKKLSLSAFDEKKAQWSILVANEEGMLICTFDRTRKKLSVCSYQELSRSVRKESILIQLKRSESSSGLDALINGSYLFRIDERNGAVSLAGISVT